MENNSQTQNEMLVKILEQQNKRQEELIRLQEIQAKNSKATLGIARFGILTWIIGIPAIIAYVIKWFIQLMIKVAILEFKAFAWIYKKIFQGIKSIIKKRKENKGGNENV